MGVLIRSPATVPKPEEIQQVNFLLGLQVLSRGLLVISLWGFILDLCGRLFWFLGFFSRICVVFVLVCTLLVSNIQMLIQDQREEVDGDRGNKVPPSLRPDCT